MTERLAVGRRLALDPDAGAARIDEEERGIARSGARRHEDARRQLGRRHAGLGAIEAPARAVAARGGRGMQGVVRVGLQERCREHDLARRDAGKERRTLRARAEARERQRTEHERRPRGERRHGAPHLLEQQAQFEEAEAAAARVLRDRRAEEPRLRERLPRRAVEPVVPSLDQREPLGRHVIREDAAGQLTERLVLRREREVHLSAPAACRGRPSR